MALSFPSNKICPRCGTGGYVWYLEDSEYVAKCTNCGHYFREEDFPMCVLDSDPKPITNADRIRQMSDEELAWFIYTKTGCDHKCMHWRSKRCTNADDVKVCGEIWLDWLKQECESDVEK